MARSLRIEYEGARYHVMSRGDRREAIYKDEEDREGFLKTLGQTCEKTGWQVHAYCLMGNHFHMVIETPQANLVVGMKWLMGTYTQRFNRRHKHWGHLFGGRYKAQVIDERTPNYLKVAANYVHLNPARANLVGKDERLEEYGWSSYPAYLRMGLRTEWLRVDRVMGEHGLQEDTVASRNQFSKRMEHLRLDPQSLAEETKPLQRGWRLGAEDFVAWIGKRLKSVKKAGRGIRARERRGADEELAERLIKEELKKMKLDKKELKRLPKGSPKKVRIARMLRTQTPMTRAWISARLHMGSPSYLSALLAKP